MSQKPSRQWESHTGFRAFLTVAICFPERLRASPAQATVSGISTKRCRHDARSPLAGQLARAYRATDPVPGSLPGSFTAFTLSESFRTRLDFVPRSTVFISSGLSVGEVDALIVSG